MTPKIQFRLLTVASYLTLMVSARIVTLCLMSVAQALGIQPWDASAWWAFALPGARDGVMMLTLVGGVQTVMAYYRLRAAQRLAALAGDAEALPLALTSLALGSAYTEGDTTTPAPTWLQWGFTTRGRLVRLIPGSVASLVFTALAGLMLWLQVTLAGPAFKPSDSVNLVFPVIAVIFVVFGLALVIGALGAGLRQPAAVSADSAGISVWTIRGPGAMIPWREVRLLEVSWFGVTRRRLLPFVRAYRTDGTSIGWPVYFAPLPGEKRQVDRRGMGEDDAVAASRAIARLATMGSGLRIRTTARSFTDPHIKPQQETAEKFKSGSGAPIAILMVGALGVAILAYRWDAAPWLSGVAAVGLGLCFARLTYWYVRNALVISRDWDKGDTREAPRNRGFLAFGDSPEQRARAHSFHRKPGKRTCAARHLDERRGYRGRGHQYARRRADGLGGDDARE